MFRNNENEEPVANANIYSGIRWDKPGVVMSAEELQNYKAQQISNNKGTTNEPRNY